MYKKRPKLIRVIRNQILKIFRWTYTLNVFYIRCRLEFPFILNYRKLLGEGVEIGVWKGEFSEHILKNWKGSKLYSIDPWKSFSDNSYKDGMNIQQIEFDKIHDDVKSLFAPFKDKSEIIRKTSAEAVELFKDSQLDFVYIDAQHHYEAVKEDIEL